MQAAEEEVSLFIKIVFFLRQGYRSINSWSSWFQSRNRDAYTFKKACMNPPPTRAMFQSRNRESYLFKSQTRYMMRIIYQFQSRNRESYLFKSVSGFRLFRKAPCFNLVIENLIFSRVGKKSLQKQNVSGFQSRNRESYLFKQTYSVEKIEASQVVSIS